MNNIKAIAKVKETKIVYLYEYEGHTYEIETPKTRLNQGVREGEVVHIMLSVMPYDAGVKVERMERIIDDE